MIEFENCMETLKYDDKIVYTQSNTETVEADLKAAKKGLGVITDAYFFEVDSDRIMRKIDFDKKKIEMNNSGLNVEVRRKGAGTASVSISGLERITNFLIDNGVLGKDLVHLRCKDVITYERGIHLLGIGMYTK